MVGFNNKIEPYSYAPHLGGGSRWEATRSVIWVPSGEIVRFM